MIISCNWLIAPYTHARWKFTAYVYNVDTEYIGYTKPVKDTQTTNFMDLKRDPFR